MEDKGSPRPPLTPRHWPGWLGVALLWLLGKTPQNLALVVSRPLGGLMYWAMRRRRRVAERNLERCFPELDADQRRRLVQESFRSLANMLFEVAWSWSAPERFLRRIGRFEGTEYVRQAQDEGRGILLVTAHFTCLEIGARLAALLTDQAAAVYRPLRSPVLEWYQNQRRSRYTQCMIRKDDLRAAVRFLRREGILWYAPDQDFGAERSEFVPFFGIQTATLKATVRLAQLSGCAVVPMLPRYDQATRRYTVRFWPALDGFPSGDIMDDLSRINALLEDHVRQAPEQYWWIHRRFKTRPPGEAPFYK